MALQAVSKTKRLSADARTMLTSHGIYQFGNSLSLIFVNLYLWRLTNDLWVNGAFNLIALLSAPLATIYAGRIAKIKDRLHAYRAGIYLTALFYLLILIAQESMVQYYYLFALLKGVSTAFYWLGHFTMIFDVSNNENRRNYLGWNSIITNIANLSGPALAGLLIASFAGLNGYTLVFGLAFAMFVLASILSIKLAKKPTHHKAYYLKFTGLMLRKHSDYFRSLVGWFIIGLPQGILMYVPAILLYYVLPQESWVGYLNAFFLCLSIVSSYLLAKRGKNESARMYLNTAAWGFAAASLLLFVNISLWTVVLFMCTVSLFKPLQANAYTAHYYKMVGELPLKDNFRIESIVIRESVINLGRAAGVLLFMVTAGQLDNVWLPWIIIFVMAAQLVTSPLIRKGINKI